MNAPGLRERKKAERYRSIAEAARTLVLDRGLDAVSIEDIAAAADVAPRTFHNYFSCKEEALIGLEPSRLTTLEANLVARPAEETPFEALRALVVPEVDQLTGVAHEWVLRTALVRRHPTLLPFYLAGIARTEEVLAQALATRMDVDADTDPRPLTLVSAVLAVVRSTMRWWHDRSPSMSLAEALKENLDSVSQGLAEISSR